MATDLPQAPTDGGNSKERDPEDTDLKNAPRAHHHLMPAMEPAEGSFYRRPGECKAGARPRLFISLGSVMSNR